LPGGLVAIHILLLLDACSAGQSEANQMQKIDKFAHAAQVVALCLPPLVMSLIGLAALSRKKGGVAVPAAKRPTPTPRPAPRSGG
jgi:hypothetical protein